MAFHWSTQRSYWMFKDVEDLKRLRVAAIADAHARISRAKSDMPADSFLTLNEEAAWLEYYGEKMKAYHEALNLPAKVLGTAMAYYKRFYLFNSVMDYDPRDIMMTCLYLACKSEETRKDIASFLAPSPEAMQAEFKESILKYELVVLEQLRFHMTIHLPYHAVEGFCIEAKAKGGVFASDKQASAVFAAAQGYAVKASLLDIMFFHPPSFVALACVLAAAEEAGVREPLASFAREKVGLDDATIGKAAALGTTIKSHAEPEVDKKVLKGVNKKLKGLKELAMDIDSNEYRQKQIRRLKLDEERAGGQ